jgi:hypothetical protein
MLGDVDGAGNRRQILSVHQSMLRNIHQEFMSKKKVSSEQRSFHVGQNKISVIPAPSKTNNT